MKFILLGVATGFSILSLLLQFSLLVSIGNLENRLAIPPRQYQIDLKPDSTFVYGDGKLLQAFEYSQNSIDSVIWHDNE